MASYLRARAPNLEQIDARMVTGAQSMAKWFLAQRDVKIGDVKVVISPDTSRENWPLGRV